MGDFCEVIYLWVKEWLEKTSQNDADPWNNGVTMKILELKNGNQSAKKWCGYFWWVVDTTFLDAPVLSFGHTSLEAIVSEKYLEWKVVLCCIHTIDTLLPRVRKLSNDFWELFATQLLYFFCIELPIVEELRALSSCNSPEYPSSGNSQFQDFHQCSTASLSLINEL